MLARLSLCIPNARMDVNCCCVHVFAFAQTLITHARTLITHLCTNSNTSSQNDDLLCHSVGCCLRVVWLSSIQYTLQDAPLLLFCNKPCTYTLHALNQSPLVNVCVCHLPPTLQHHARSCTMWPLHCTTPVAIPATDQTLIISPPLLPLSFLQQPLPSASPPHLLLLLALQPPPLPPPPFQAHSVPLPRHPRYLALTPPAPQPPSECWMVRHHCSDAINIIYKREERGRIKTSNKCCKGTLCHAREKRGGRSSPLMSAAWVHCVIAYKRFTRVACSLRL